ncbi:MAG: TonB-dependent receptor [Proteobacteria bacterium]|nr:TonB-dependent receptor [Pseudomonadota bacterium]
MKFKSESSVTRSFVCVSSLLGVSSVLAQNPTPALTNTPPTRLPDVVVGGRADDLTGIAASATQGTVGVDHLQARPLLRPGELLETIPGVIITQHSGAGKANQYFLRGFNLDHGTDFATSLNGMPVNLPTHAHGQGYTDLNWIIPELVTRIDYRKGPYAAADGDFASAGAADLTYARPLLTGFWQLEGGSFGYARGVFAASPKLGNGTLLYGVELMHEDGPWERADNFRKGNGVLRYSTGDDALGWSVMGFAYHGEWNATDQIALRAITGNNTVPGGFQVGRFGTLDPTTGGNSQRYGTIAEWHRSGDDSTSRLMAYAYYYDLDLFSNFTYFLNDPTDTTPDQFEQADQRVTAGFKASHDWNLSLLGRELENSAGLQFRNDLIHNGLYTTSARIRTGTTRVDDVWQTSVSPYYENKTQWAEKLRTVVGARADLYRFEVASLDPRNSGTVTDFIASPKGSVILGPWAKTEFYLNAGMGFHSNDGRGATTTVDPASGAAVSKVNPLVRTYGAEVGTRTTWVPGLQSTLSAWWLDIDSELLFVGDAGTTEASRPSRRYGLEFANYYTPTKWLTFDADVSLSQARFRDPDPAGQYVPGSIETVVAAGVAVHDLNGFFGGLRLRYFGPRALVEDNTIRSTASALVNLQVGYEFNPKWKLTVDVFNLLDRKASDISYYYESRLRGETINPDPALNGGYNDIHLHPAEPVSLRVAVTGRF